MTRLAQKGWENHCCGKQKGWNCRGGPRGLFGRWHWPALRGKYRGVWIIQQIVCVSVCLLHGFLKACYILLSKKSTVLFSSLSCFRAKFRLNVLTVFKCNLKHLQLSMFLNIRSSTSNYFFVTFPKSQEMLCIKMLKTAMQRIVNVSAIQKSFLF